MVSTQSVKIEIPESLSDIKISIYKKFMSLVSEENATELGLYLFCGLSPQQQEGMKKRDLDEIGEAIGLVLSEKPSLVKTFNYKGKDYGFHPKLEDISLGEYVDLDELLKEPYKNAEKILGILYRPITKKMYGRYDIEPYDPEVHNGLGFQDLTADILVGCMLFFYRLEIRLRIHSIRSLLEKEKETNPALMSKLTSQKSGDGMEQYINSLEEAYSNLIK